MTIKRFKMDKKEEKNMNYLDICQIHFGAGWQSKLARYLGINSRNVREWVANERPVPSWAQKKIELLNIKCENCGAKILKS